MKNTMLFRSARRQYGLARFHLLAIAAVVAILTTVVPQANAQILPNRNLVNTWFAVNAVPVTATCAAAACVSPNVLLFPPLPIVCPGAVGATCTFYIHLETNDTLTMGDKGRFQFLVAGVAPNPGPTAGLGYFVWDNHDPNSAIAVPFSHSYAVTGVVTNNAPNQAWPVSVSVSCVDNAGTPVGCTAVTQLSNLEVGVYVP